MKILYDYRNPYREYTIETFFQNDVNMVETMWVLWREDKARFVPIGVPERHGNPRQDHSMGKSCQPSDQYTVKETRPTVKYTVQIPNMGFQKITKFIPRPFPTKHSCLFSKQFVIHES